MNDYLNQGHAELAPEASTQPTWYLPHHGVVSVNKPGKVRVVYDCAAKSGGVSLNDNLLQGPDLVNELVGVLLRFREGTIAVSADVKQMFHQVRVPEHDRDAFRFLWFPGGDLRAEAQVYRMCVHVFGATSSPSCAAFALRQVAEEFKSEVPADVIQAINRSFYVDDCLRSVDDPIEAKRLVDELTGVLARRGFKLTKWISSDPQVLAAVPEEQRSPSVTSFQLGDDLPQERALGLTWDVKEDAFRFQVPDRKVELTRRGVLSDVSSLYDPLGLVAPVLLPAKRLLQELCRDGLRWDDALPDALAKRWLDWRERLSNHVGSRFRDVTVLGVVQLHLALSCMCSVMLQRAGTEHVLT